MSRWGEGRRIVDLVELAKNLYCKQCRAVLDLNRTEKEIRVGLASVLCVTCSCGVVNNVHTEPKQQETPNNTITYLINTIASTSLMQCGGMGYIVRNFLTQLKIPVPSASFNNLSLDSCSSETEAVGVSPGATDITFGTELTSQTDDLKPQTACLPNPATDTNQTAESNSAELWSSLDIKPGKNNSEQALTSQGPNTNIKDNLNNNENNNKDNTDDDGNDEEDDQVDEENEEDNEDNEYSVPVTFAQSEIMVRSSAPGNKSGCKGTTRSRSAESLNVNHVNINQRVAVQNTAMILNTSSTDKPYGCGVCFKAYVTEDLCRSHIQTHIGDKPFLCEDCGRGFVCEYNLKLHKRQHTGERPFRCEDCGRGFIRWFTLKRHRQKHQGVVHFTCQICGDAFSSRESLKRHRRVHTGEKPFSCDQCDKTFRGESNLYAHRRRHFGIKPYKCPDCEAAFVESTHLTRHRRTHTKEQPYICETCGARYTQSGSLAAHRKKHTGEPKKVKVLQCTDCGKMFNSYTQLKRHKRIHTGEKPYVCDFCQTAFTQSSSLKAHRRIHTGERPFKCEVCGESFLYPRTLKRHVKKHTDGEHA